MFAHRLEDAADVRVYGHWFLLSFLAGSVNAGGYLACHRFVSHVTGFATLAGIDWAAGRWHEMASMLTVPLYFLGGAMASAFLVDRRSRRGERPLYEVVMGLVAAALALAAAGGWFGLFGAFGFGVGAREDYFLLALLCGASGLQNAVLTSSSGATIRTTHLTGLTTDLGIGLVRAAGLPASDATRKRETRANGLRLGTIASFVLGSAIGALLFAKQGYLAFAMPAAIAAYATVVAGIEGARAVQSGQGQSGQGQFGQGQFGQGRSRRFEPASPAIKVTTKKTKKT